MKVSIIIVSYNTCKLLEDCLNSIFSQSWKHDYSVIIVDNNSQDGSVEMVGKKFPKVRLITNKENNGFSAGNNQGIKQSDAPYVLLLNTDTVVQLSALDKLIDSAEGNKWGVSSCKLLNKDKTLQPNTGDLPKGISLLSWLTGADGLLTFLPTFHQTNPNFYKGNKLVGWVSGSVMLISKDVIDKLAGFDQNIFMYAEDTDLCWRAKDNGFSIGWTDSAEIVHLGGASSDNPAYAQWLGEFKGLVYLYRKNYGALAAIGIQWLMRLFILARIIAFSILGKGRVAQTYGKILFNF